MFPSILYDYVAMQQTYLYNNFNLTVVSANVICPVDPNAT